MTAQKLLEAAARDYILAVAQDTDNPLNLFIQPYQLDGESEESTEPRIYALHEAGSRQTPCVVVEFPEAPIYEGLTQADKMYDGKLIISTISSPEDEPADALAARIDAVEEAMADETAVMAALNTEFLCTYCIEELGTNTQGSQIGDTDGNWIEGVSYRVVVQAL
jgi:hypothetical protein